MWLGIFFLGLVFAADEPEVSCPRQPRERLVEAADQVEQSWLRLDASGFDLARNRLGQLIQCVRTPITVADAILMHRARGLIAFVDGDLDAGRRSYAAVHLLEPTWQPDETLVPREHPLWKVFESAVDDDEVSKTTAFHTLPEGEWSVDGTRFPLADDPRDASGRPLGEYGLPADRSFVLQVFDTRDRVTYTGYHFSTTDVPIEDLLVTRYLSTQQAKRRRKAARIAGSVLGGALLAAGGATFGMGWIERERFTKEQLPYESAALLETQAQANMLSSTGYGLAGAGALAFTLGWAIPW